MVIAIRPTNYRQQVYEACRQLVRMKRPAAERRARPQTSEQENKIGNGINGQGLRSACCGTCK